jgi:diaminopimelate decarboxylase
MSALEYREGELHMEGVNLTTIATRFGTPTYVYSRAAITAAYQAYADALGDFPGMICYAVKANSNIGVLGLLADLGAGFDIVSIGELERVLIAGGNPSRIVFSGVGKKAEEMVRALDVGVHCFNVESASELELLSQVAGRQNKVANISLRVNPDVDAKTHPYISTGLKENKFGIDIKAAVSVYQRASTLPNLNIVGIDCHIGSQLTDTSPFLDALDRVLGLIDQLAELGINIHHLDLGGGLGVTYRDEEPPAIHDYLDAVKARLKGRQLSLMLEPGRSIVANAGVMLTRVLYLKPTENKNFAIIDGAMNDNIRPSLYQAWQEIVSVLPHDGEAKLWDLVGPVCETGDFLGKDRELTLAEGDLLALKSAGAYGFSMSSNYNTRGRAAEIIVDGSEAYAVRRRETFDDMIAQESLLPR